MVDGTTGTQDRDGNKKDSSATLCFCVSVFNPFSCFNFVPLKFVSDFELRISNLLPPRAGKQKHPARLLFPMLPISLVYYPCHPCNQWSKTPVSIYQSLCPTVSFVQTTWLMASFNDAKLQPTTPNSSQRDLTIPISKISAPFAPFRGPSNSSHLCYPCHPPVFHSAFDEGRWFLSSSGKLRQIQVNKGRLRQIKVRSEKKIQALVS